MQRVLTATAFALAASLSGCATAITPQELASADFGPPPTHYQETIKAAFEPDLIDPTAPLYTFQEPVKGGISGNPIAGIPRTFGYIACGTINGKNRMGGYSGASPFIAVIKNDQVTFKRIGDLFGSGQYGETITNIAIQNMCTFH